jgi:hypothetical protein
MVPLCVAEAALLAEPDSVDDSKALGLVVGDAVLLSDAALDTSAVQLAVSDGETVGDEEPVGKGDAEAGSVRDPVALAVTDPDDDDEPVGAADADVRPEAVALRVAPELPVGLGVPLALMERLPEGDSVAELDTVPLSVRVVVALNESDAVLDNVPLDDCDGVALSVGLGEAERAPDTVALVLPVLLGVAEGV